MVIGDGNGRRKGVDGGRPDASASAANKNAAATSNIAVASTVLRTQLGSEAGEAKSQAGTSDDCSAGSVGSILNEESAHNGSEGEKGSRSGLSNDCNSASVTSLGSSIASDSAAGSESGDAVGEKGVWNDDWDPQEERNRKVASIYPLFKPCLCAGMGMPEVP